MTQSTSYRKTLFISDLHLEAKSPHITAQFLVFLEKLTAREVDALYILGDLFETWIGDDDTSTLHTIIIHALKSTVNKGIPIYFMRGNRDFLIGKRFSKATGIKLLPDIVKLSLYQTDVLIMHGDTLCTLDTAYLKARKKAKNWFLQKLFLCLPLSTRRAIAEKMRSKSTQHKSNISLQIMDVTLDAVTEVMSTYQVSYLIHGHTHRPAIHNLFIRDKSAKRIVLGAWDHCAKLLSWDEKGSISLSEI